MPETFRGDFASIDSLVFCPCEALYEKADIIVVIGGDGSIIRASASAAVHDRPIIGINLGRLGYLAELELDELDLLKAVFDGNYSLEKRMMLAFETLKPQRVDCVLNDIVLTSRGNTRRVVDLSLYITLPYTDSEVYAGSFSGDGIIVSTPTGSTAYALAAGGPIIAPSLDCIGITPICTHSLTARPMLFSADTRLRLENTGRTDVNISADGFGEYSLCPGESIKIQRSEHKVNMIRVRRSSFYEVLRRKMADR